MQKCFLEAMHIFKNFKGKWKSPSHFSKGKAGFRFQLWYAENRFSLARSAQRQLAAHFQGKKRQRLAISRTEKSKKMQERGGHTPSCDIQPYETFLKQRFFFKLQKVARAKSPSPFKIWGNRISGNVSETCEKCVFLRSRICGSKKFERGRGICPFQSVSKTARLFLRAFETRDFRGSRIVVSRTRKPVHLDRRDWLFEVPTFWGP